MTTTPYKDWWKNVVGAAVPWLAGGPNGQAEGGAWPSVIDEIISRLYDARNQAYPDYCAVDALLHLGGDRKLIQGGNESNDSFRARLKDAWGQWSRAGTACGVLEQLAYYSQSVEAVWVQQNGLAYQFGSMPTDGQDPTALLVSTDCSQLAVSLTSDMSPPTNSSAGRSIPDENSWWEFDCNTDLCNRFAIYYPSWPFSALAPAYFTNSTSATVSWPFAFPSASYSVIYGMPTDSVTIWNDGTAQTTTGTTLRASDAWTGTAWAVAFASGVNPLNVWTQASYGALQRIISTFRPNALCVGVYAAMQGKAFGWPVQAQGDNTMAAAIIDQVIGAF